MRKKFVIWFLILGFGLLPAASALAQKAGGNTQVYFMNMNSSSWANVTPIFYDQGGNQAAVGETISLQGSGHGVVDASTVEGLEGGKIYTLVLDSDQPLASVALWTDTSRTDSTAAIKAPPVGAELYLPGLEVDPSQGIGGTIYLANPGPDPVSLSIEFHDSSGELLPYRQRRLIRPRYFDDVDPNSGTYFDLQTLDLDIRLYTTFGGTIKLEYRSSGVIVHPVLHPGPDSTTAHAAQPATSSTVNLPLLANGFQGQTSSFAIQNPNSTSVDVQVNYHNNTGAQINGGTQTIQGQGSAKITPSGIPSDSTWSATVTSSGGSIAGAANIVGANGQAGSYGGFPSGDSTVALPLVKQNTTGTNTWLTVQNTSAGDANTMISYHGQYGSRVASKSIKIPKKGSHTWNARDDLGKGDFIGSALVSSNGSVAAVAQVDGPGPSSYIFGGLNSGAWSNTASFTGFIPP